MPDPLTYMRAERGAWAVAGLRALIAALPDHLVMAEIGVFAGESTRLFVESGKVTQLFAVDPWCDYTDVGGWTCPFPWEVVKTTFTDWARQQPPVITLSMDSVGAARLIADGSLDLVYIDACHTYAAVRDDIALWTPKLKATGWLAGHDYSPAFPGVIHAVFDACRKVRVFDDTSWLCPRADVLPTYGAHT